MPEAGHTVPDEIPPVHVLEAAHKQDRRETEDLLAGFDRPGRGPKKPSPERDFVDYYAKKSGADSGRRSGAAPGAGGPRQIDVSTVVKPRKGEGMPVWLAWAGAAVLMLGFGGAVAYFATSEARPTMGTSMGSGTATTMTGAPEPMQSSRDIIPPPAPSEPEPATTTTTPLIVAEPPTTTTDAPPRATGRHDPRSAGSSASALTGSGSTTASGHRKPPPRDDFIRDM